MKRTQFEPVPVAVPRWWLKDWMLSLFITAFGYNLGAKQPFRWLMFRELSARERMKMRDRVEILTESQIANDPRFRVVQGRRLFPYYVTNTGEWDGTYCVIVKGDGTESPVQDFIEDGVTEDGIKKWRAVSMLFDDAPARLLPIGKSISPCGTEPMFEVRLP